MKETCVRRQDLEAERQEETGLHCQIHLPGLSSKFFRAPKQEDTHSLSMRSSRDRICVVPSIPCNILHCLCKTNDLPHLG